MALQAGDPEAARALQEEALAICRELADTPGIASALSSLGDVTCNQGDYGAARALYQESLSLQRQLGEKVAIAGCLEGIAETTGGQGQPAHAARLYGAAEALRHQIGAGLSPAHRAHYERQVAACALCWGKNGSRRCGRRVGRCRWKRRSRPRWRRPPSVDLSRNLIAP
jgi:tetratricopeptide (TPR) repeat protein